MPRFLRRFLIGHSLRRHLTWALAAALGLRALSAWFVYGPQALDDYKHGVWPAYQMYAGQTLDIPEYRSLLLNWFLSLPLHLAHLVGVDTALGQVRAMYFELGLVSLLAVVGAYFFARRERSRLAGRLALWLTAVFPLMPFVSTRAFGEAVAASFVALGFGLLPSAGFLGFLALGVATLFRFHAGLLYFAAGAWVVSQRRWRALAGGLLAGLLTLALEAYVDVASGRAPLGTLRAYLSENDGGGARYGVSPWYNPWIFVLLVSLAPFSFVFARRLPALARRHGGILFSWLFFVGVHSLVPHKEERFLYPILALELWTIANLWAASAHVAFARRVYSKVIAAAVALGLVITCFVNTQAGEIEPPALIEAAHRDVAYLDDASLFGQSRVLFYFLRAPSEKFDVGAADLTATRIDDELERRPEREAVALLTSRAEDRDRLRALAGASTRYAVCGELRQSQSPVDRLLYTMNPRHNQRRRPTWWVVCERSSRARL